MLKRTRKPSKRFSEPSKPPGRRPRPDIVHSSLYLPTAVYEALRKAAFDERCKIHDIVMEGIEAALKKRGYHGAAEMRAGKRP